MPARAATLVQVWLDVSEAEAALLVPRATDAGALASALVSEPQTRRWATAEEVSTATEWLAAAARKLNEPALGEALTEESHVLRAEWRFPEAPLVRLYRDSDLVAIADYLPSSASAHWFLRWEGDDDRAHPAEFPIMLLAGHVPEEADEDESMRATILDEAIGAAAAELTGRVVRLDPRDA